MADLKGAFVVVDNVAEGIQGGFGSWTTSAWFPVVWFWLKVVMWIVGFSFGVLIWWKFWKQYKVRVGLRIKSGGGITEIKDDKAKIIVDEHGKTKLVLFATRKGGVAYNCPVPASKYKLKKGKLDYYDLQIDDNDQMHPVEIGFKARFKSLYNKTTKEEIKAKLEHNANLVAGKLTPFESEDIAEEDQPFMKPRPQDRDSWVLDELKLKQERMQKKSWMQEYMPLIVITTLSVVVILTFYFLFQNIGTGMSSLASSFRSIAQNCAGI